MKISFSTKQAIDPAEVIWLSQADQECFAQALLSPPPPAPALERALARRYTLAELLATSDYSQPQPPEEREWVAAPAVGAELE